MRFRLIIKTIASQLGLEGELNNLYFDKRPLIEPCGELTKITIGDDDLYIRTNLINTISTTKE